MDMNEIKKALSEATPGPWKANYGLGWFVRLGDDKTVFVGRDAGSKVVKGSELYGPDAYLIAKTPEYLQYLIGKVERLTQTNKALNDESMRHAEFFRIERNKVKELRKALEECEAEIEQWRDPGHAMACVKVIVNKALEATKP